MCGIAGITGSHRQNSIQAMTDAMRHRGPDDDGFYHDNFISLGFRRLAIVDLTTGQQPISNEDDSIILICNGEIYNSPTLRKDLIEKGHQFKTHCDVEVILHLYEEYAEDCVKHLQGMFAFAIWDKPNQKLMLARDHLGQNPVFFCHQNGAFAFASEVKGLLASKIIEPKIDTEGMWHYLSLRYMPDAHSMFAGINKLPAATYLVFENCQIRTQKYWDVDFNNKLQGSEEDIVDQLDELLNNTVKSHLLSDVRVGTFLSGGIDSGTVSSMMARQSEQPIPRFSIGTKEKEFNELPFAKMVSDKYNMESHEKIVEPDLIHAIPAMIQHMDEPADPFGFGVYLVSEVAAQHVKVVLGGDGGDENFAGYDRYYGQRMVDYYCMMPKWLRRNVIKNLTDRIPETFGYKSMAQKAAWVNEMSLFSGGERYAQSLGVLRFTRESKEKLFTDQAKQNFQEYSSAEKILSFFNADNASHVVDKMLYTDLMTRIPDHLLMIGDRMTMAHSLESRAPLVDYKVVEFAATIPVDMKLKGKNLKHILRQVASRYLPSDVVNLEKQGFRFPLGIWFRTDLKDFLRNLFAQSRFVELGIFNPVYINGILEEHIAGKVDHNYRIWCLLNLEIWYRLYFEGETIESLQDYTNALA